MNDFEGLLSTGYGFRTSRNAPMASSRPSSSASPSIRPNSRPPPPSTFLEDDALFRPVSARNASDFDDVFRPTPTSPASVNLDSIFGGSSGSGGGGGDSPASRFTSLPVYDRPVYDDEDAPSSSNTFENIFAPSSARKSERGVGGGGGGGGGDVFDDLLGSLGKKEAKAKAAEEKSNVAKGGGASDFDDLLPGFSGSSSINWSSSDTTKKPSTSSVLDDPFVVLESTSPPVSSSSGVFNDPLEEIGNINNSGRKKYEAPSSGGVFDDIDPLDGFAQSVPPFFTETNGREKDESPLRTGSRVSGRQTSDSADMGVNSSLSSPEREREKKMPVGDFGESPHNFFDVPSIPVGSNKSAPNVSSPVYSNSSSRESYPHDAPEKNTVSDEVWLTVSEIPLFTQPTTAPPPSRPPPPRPARFSRGDHGSFPASNAQRRANDYSSLHSSNSYFQNPKSAPAGAKGSFASSIDEPGEFPMGPNQSDMDESSAEDFDSNSVAAASAAAMKEAMDRAEVKFRYAKGVREREHTKASRSRESVQVDKEVENAQDRGFREGQERLQRQKEEEGRRREEEERMRIEKEQEEKEKEKRRIERERELARQAVERASREARERAAIEARTRADRVAVQKAQAEARERAARAAVQKAQAEARERAAADAKERAEKAAAEAKEKARAEAREREARERAAAAMKGNQQRAEPDLDSIFGPGSRVSSAPRPNAKSSDPFEAQFQSRPAPEATRTSSNSASTMRKASSSTNIADDLNSIFGPSSSSSSTFGVFQEVEGETEDRRKARFDREQRTQERAAKALAEKNARDLEAQREQTERHRFAETLDAEIKRWAAGKEGNLRALLSTMQYVLWPECGWQPVSLTDLITGASVKKVYRKATLCIHPDKVQQKGATLQQKYVAEKVFDLLKEAWNKFNSEELF